MYISQEDITILSVYISDSRAAKHIMQNTGRRNRQIHSCWLIQHPHIRFLLLQS